jgi:hypothetical protein
MGEFGATSLIARPERPTMPIAIYRFLGRPGAANYVPALAMSTLLMLVCTLGFLAIERFRVEEVVVLGGRRQEAGCREQESRIENQEVRAILRLASWICMGCPAEASFSF